MTFVATVLLLPAFAGKMSKPVAFVALAASTAAVSSTSSTTTTTIMASISLGTLAGKVAYPVTSVADRSTLSAVSFGAFAGKMSSPTSVKVLDTKLEHIFNISVMPLPLIYRLLLFYLFCLAIIFFSSFTPSFSSFSFMPHAINYSLP